MLIAMELVDDQKPNKVEITNNIISAYRNNGFHDFIATKKQEYNLLSTVTNLPFIGGLASWGLKTIGGVNTEEAKLFLGRIFEAENEFLSIVAKLEHDDHNIKYLQDIFDNLPRDIHITKSREELVKAMRIARHQRVPIPKQMGEKKTNSEYSIINKDFLPFAACNLWAMHWLAEQQSSPKRHKRKRFKS